MEKVRLMRPVALGYIVVSTKNLDDWAAYGAGQLGLQRVDRSRSTLAFRMDDRKQRILVNEDGRLTISAYGWEMADAAAIDAMAARVEAAGVRVARRRARWRRNARSPISSSSPIRAAIASSSFTGRRSPRIRSRQAGTSPASAPARSDSGMW